MATRDWRSIVIGEMDRDWPRKSVRVTAYEFSNGRKFEVTERPGQPYAWTTSTS